MGLQRFSSVVTPGAQSLATLANVKADLGITTTDEDAYLTRLISQASFLAARYCGRTLLTETLDDTFFMEDREAFLLLSRFPVTGIASVTVDGTVIASSKYTTDLDVGKIFYLSDDGTEIEDWDADKIVIRFTGGHTTVPPDLEGAAIGMIKHMRASRRRDPSVRSVRVPDVIETTFWVKGPGESNLPPDIAGVLDLYRAARL